MSESTVSEKMKKLPPEAKKQAQDFVDFLYERYVKDESKKSAKKSISESSFFGMWKDREDMQDSTEWVRKVRKSQWPNL
jgi:mRNA-degrading endonuclease RelE of RelBE toxin-antitoxin system